MKCTVTAGELSAALRGPCDRAKPNSAIAILKHVCLTASGMTLSILGHDMDSSSQASIAAEVEVEGARAIPADPLARLVSGLPKAAAVTIEIVDTDAVIKSGRSRYKLPVLNAADMPSPLSAEGGFTFDVSASDLDQIFVRPRSAMALKDPRPMCHGVYLHPEGGKLSSAATSGLALMRFLTGIDAADFKGAIIPRSAGEEIIKMGPGTVTLSDRIISISSGNRVYASKLIAGVFPDHYRKMILTEGATVKVDRDAVIECMSRLRAVSDFSGSELVDISAGDGEVSFAIAGTADGSETVECEVSAPTAVCLRSSQLLDALKTMTGDHVEFLIPNERSPFRVIDLSEPSAIAVIAPCASTTLKSRAA